MAAVQKKGATWAIQATLLAIVLLSVGNFIGTFNQKLSYGLPHIQQVFVLALWLAVMYASCFIPPTLRMNRSPFIGAAVAFFGLAILSVIWSNHSDDSFLKCVALFITTVGVYRLATRMPLDAIIACATIGLVVLAATSLVLVAFFPEIGVATGWMQEGLWQGVFDSKQSLGLSGAMLMFFAYRNLMRRGGIIVFLISFGLGAACVIGSGSRGGGILALAGIIVPYLSHRSLRLQRALAFGPFAMTVFACVLTAYIVTTGHDYFPWFGSEIDFDQRTQIWQYSLRHLEQNPLFGYGLAGFWSTPQLLSGFEHEHGWVLDNYHSGYLAVLIETGVVGMTLFAVCVLLFGYRLSWLRANGLIPQASYDLIVGFTNLMFLINFEETLFLRSTDFSEALLVAFLIAGAGAPVQAAQLRAERSRPMSRQQSAAVGLPRRPVDV